MGSGEAGKIVENSKVSRIKIGVREAGRDRSWDDSTSLAGATISRHQFHRDGTHLAEDNQSVEPD